MGVDAEIDDKVSQLEQLVKQLDNAAYDEIPMLCDAIRDRAGEIERLAESAEREEEK